MPPMRTSRARWIASAAVALAAVAFVACSQADHDPQGAGPSCKTDCGSGAVGGTGTSKDAGAASDAGGGAADAGPGVDVTATVVIYSEPTFSVADSYQGAATLEGDKVGGGKVSVPYGATNGTSVTLPGVAAGSGWLYVDDSSGGQTGIFSTYSLQSLPANGTLALPVISRPLLLAIFTKLPIPGVVDVTAAQVVLRFQRKGVPLAGISLSAPVKGATVAFDSGPGVFTTDAKATSTGGMILLLNTAVAAAGGSITVGFVDAAADAGATTYTLTIPTAAGAASFAEIQLAAP